PGLGVCAGEGGGGLVGVVGSDEMAGEVGRRGVVVWRENRMMCTVEFKRGGRDRISPLVMYVGLIAETQQKKHERAKIAMRNPEVTDIAQKDKNKAKPDKTEHGIEKSAKNQKQKAYPSFTDQPGPT
nr:hypothetical protein [Tanacetum cinerariifolium]